MTRSRLTTVRTITLGSALLLALSASVLQAEGPKETKAAVASSAGMDAIKKLAGTWVSAAEGSPEGQMSVSFKVSSGGSVVLETLFPGTEKEMTDAYTMDGKSLMVTHYCEIGNQPRMVCKNAADPKSLVFTFHDGSNLNPHVDGYMGALTLTIVDDNHIREDWTFFQGGKAQNHTTFDLARKV